LRGGSAVDGGRRGGKKGEGKIKRGGEKRNLPGLSDWKKTTTSKKNRRRGEHQKKRDLLEGGTVWRKRVRGEGKTRGKKGRGDQAQGMSPIGHRHQKEMKKTQLPPYSNKFNLPLCQTYARNM